LKELKNLQYPYYPIKLWIDSLIFLTLFSAVVFFTILHKNQPFGIILAIFLIALVARNLKKSIKNLYRNLRKKPALELTDDYLFDHINNIKIHWSNIVAIDTISIRGNTFVRYILRDKKKYSEQLEGLYAKITFNFPDPENLSIKTELSLIKGKNEEIYNQIYKFYQVKKIP
jgi:hypothetical protein